VVFAAAKLLVVVLLVSVVLITVVLFCLPVCGAMTLKATSGGVHVDSKSVQVLLMPDLRPFLLMAAARSHSGPDVIPMRALPFKRRCALKVVG
jgi:hypothetical protein